MCTCQVQVEHLVQTNVYIQLQEKESKDECEKLVMEVEAMTEKLKSSIKCDTAKQEALNEEVITAYSEFMQINMDRKTSGIFL